MAEAGADPRYVMGQIGHRRAEFTLAVYTDFGNRKHAANAALGELLLGSDSEPVGTNGSRTTQASGGTTGLQSRTSNSSPH
jgi:hypothetical protein